VAEKEYVRLADWILDALKVALDQKDLAVADLLMSALELTMTRGAGGKDFTERRDFSAEVEEAMNQRDALRKAQRG
jgi:hypothetical protein